MISNGYFVSSESQSDGREVNASCQYFTPYSGSIGENCKNIYKAKIQTKVGIGIDPDPKPYDKFP